MITLAAKLEAKLQSQGVSPKVARFAVDHLKDANPAMVPLLAHQVLSADEERLLDASLVLALAVIHAESRAEVDHDPG